MKGLHYTAQTPTPVYGVTDEETGTPYELVSGFVDLEQYVGERVTIQGVAVPGPGDPSKPPLLNVTQIQPADRGDNNDPPVNDKATLSFELTVDRDPPAGATFFGNVRTGEGGPGLYAPLTDSDEDRVYTGSTTVDRFGPGPRPVPVPAAAAVAPMVAPATSTAALWIAASAVLGRVAAGYPTISPTA